MARYYTMKTDKKIIWARYGVREHGQWIDVTEKVRSLTQPATVGLEVFGLPDGTENKLKAVWMLRADGTESTVPQNNELRPENWEELVYGSGKSEHRWLQHTTDGIGDKIVKVNEPKTTLKIHSALYGIFQERALVPGDYIDVTEKLQSLVQNGSLDVTVTNDSLGVGNPFRGQKKKLWVTYSYDGGEPVTIEREEREWLIIGQSAGYVKQIWSEAAADGLDVMHNKRAQAVLEPKSPSLMSPTALTDLLIRRFKIPDRRLRGPMPIDLRDFHRNDLAKLFAELGFTKGVEVGVAEGHYSEVLCKSIPNLELLCVDPWHRYSGNPWAHSQEHQDFSKAETERKLKGYNAKLIQDYSMNAVRDVPENSLDFCYIDGNHFFDYAMGDLIEWSKRVRSGGIVALDDFYHFKRTWGGVVEAVQAYTNAHKITLWFAIDAPNSVDVFWIKP